MFSFWRPAASPVPAPFPSAPVDYGKIWDKHHRNLGKLCKEAGIPEDWMKDARHRPKDRDDFIRKMSSAYYTDFSAGCYEEGVLPICAGLALTQVICSVLPAKYGDDKQVSKKAVMAAIYTACPEMLDAGIRPQEVIDKCNGAHNQKGLIIPGPTLSDAPYQLKLEPEVFNHGEYCQALTMADCIEKLGCRAMAVVVKPQLDPPLHAMVTSNVGYSNGGVAISAFDIQCDEEAEREQEITEKNFHQLIVCNVVAQRRGDEQKLSAQKGFQEQFESDLLRSRRVTKLKSPGCFGPLSCGRAQMDKLQFDQAMLESMRDAQESFIDFHQKLLTLKVNFKNEFEGDFPKELLDKLRKEFKEAPFEAGKKLARFVASSLARKDEQSDFAILLEKSGFNAEKISGFTPRLMKVLEQSGFDEEMLHAFRLGADDLWRSLARRCLC